MRRLSKDSKSYRNAAILFLISGIVFILVGIVDIVAGKIAVFITIGIALVVVSMVFLQQSRKPTDN